MHEPEILEDEDDFEPEEIEVYCVSCKDKTIMENPTPVWTRKGAPGTRGTCDICAGNVFRMGRTDAHNGLRRPDTTPMFNEKAKPPARKGKKSAQQSFAAYINYHADDTEIAKKISDRLSALGIPAWFDAELDQKGDGSQWASGVHPGLAECSHMIVILSAASAADERITKEWTYFREEKRPVLVAVVAETDVPDGLRNRPRFDFVNEYKIAFRRLSEQLFE